MTAIGLPIPPVPSDGTKRMDFCREAAAFTATDMNVGAANQLFSRVKSTN
jgi:hypothetical protein